MNMSDSSSLKGNLKAVLATGGAFAGGTLLSQGAVIYTPENITVSAPSGSIWFSLSGQQASTTYFSGAQGYLRNISPAAMFESAGASATPIVYAATSYLQRLASGAAINGTRTFSGTGYAYFGPPWSANGQHGYIGLEFNPGTGLRFGWAEVSLNAGNTLTLYGFAYDNTGGQILAGVTAVPEPATTGAIAAALAGSVAAFEARRRRKAARLATVQPELNATV